MSNESYVFMCCLQKAAKKTINQTKTATTYVVLALVAGLIGTAATPLAEASQKLRQLGASADFSVDFVDCNEFVGITPVPLSERRASHSHGI